MKRTFALLLAFAMLAATLAGCVKVADTPAPTQAPATATKAPEAPKATDVPEKDPMATDEHVELNLSVFYNSSVKMKYTVDGSKNKPQSEYVAADGKTYREGDWKPVWAALQDRLNFTINDVTPTDAKDIAASFTSLQAQNFAGVDVMVGGAVNLNTEGVTNGTFLDLSKYLDVMPNFKAFLEENSIVKTTITAGNGAIYYAPYFDGYDDVERMLIVRADWVQKLLDDDDAAYDTKKTVKTYYTPYMPETLDTKVTAVKADGSGTQSIAKKYDKNIISVQNELKTKNGKTLTEALKAYIDATYAGVYAKRSDLFCGQDAAYDADELVALMRCVYANPQLLTGQSAQDVVPFFPRKYQAGRLQQLFSFMEIWGVRGLESRLGYLYIDEKGELQDGRFEENTMDGIERLNMLYKEGLILKDFDKNESTSGLAGSEHRDRLYAANLGFMTLDYNQTTTVYNSNDTKIDGFNITPILPPVADWDGNGNYYQFTASWRSVKSDGWAILAAIEKDEAKLYRALKLFDYMYSTEGNRLMSYGPEAWIDGTITYGGKEVPKLSDAALNELKTLAGGNYTNYYRMWLGATFPIGYVKEQGMEYQTVTEKGKVGLDYIEKACELGSMKHLVVNTQTAEAPQFMMVPTTFSTTKEEENIIKDNCSDLAVAFKNGNNDKDRILFTDYVLFGFGGKDANGNVLLTKEALIDYLTNTLNGSTYLECYRSAYNRMK